MTDRAIRSRKIARAIDTVAARASSLSFDDLDAELREVESDLLAAPDLDPSEEGEIRRRVAEIRLYLSVDRELPFDRLRELFRSVGDLGFGTPEKEVSVRMIFARACLAHGRTDRAVEELGRSREIVVRETQAAPGPLWTQLARQIDEFLRKAGEP